MGLEPTRGCLTSTCSAAELPTRYEDYRGSPFSSLSVGGEPCSHVGIEPTFSAWKADTSADRPRARVVRRGGSRGTRTHNGHAARTCFRDRLLIRPDDFHEAAVAGLEPAFVSLTASRPTIGPHRKVIQSAWSDLNRVTARTTAFGLNPPYRSAASVACPKHADFQTFPHADDGRWLMVNG